MVKSSCEIILGTYEEFILGFKYNKKEQESKQTFAVHSHAGSIRCVTTNGEYLASGGTDDRIVIYNLKTRKEQCLLTHHNSTVTCVQFIHGNTHLISGGQDGMLAISKVGSWQLEKVWEKAHKGAAIIDIAVHDSGNLALTLGADATLRTWNLVKGRQAYVVNLNNKSKETKCLHSIKWAPDGTRFVLVGSEYTDIWSIESGGILKSIKHDNKVSSGLWYSDDKIIVGYENGKFSVVNIDTEEIKIHDGHNSRVKCLALHENNLVSASSTGEIKIWNTKFEQLCVTNAGCRFTCMCIVPLDTGKEQDLGSSTCVDVLTDEVNSSQKKNTWNKKRVVIEIDEENQDDLSREKKPKNNIGNKTVVKESAGKSVEHPTKKLKKKKQKQNSS